MYVLLVRHANYLHVVPINVTAYQGLAPNASLSRGLDSYPGTPRAIEANSDGVAAQSHTYRSSNLTSCLRSKARNSSWKLRL